MDLVLESICSLILLSQTKEPPRLSSWELHMLQTLVLSCHKGSNYVVELLELLCCNFPDFSNIPQTLSKSLLFIPIYWVTINEFVSMSDFYHVSLLVGAAKHETNQESLVLRSFAFELPSFKVTAELQCLQTVRELYLAKVFEGFAFGAENFGLLERFLFLFALCFRCCLWSDDWFSMAQHFWLVNRMLAKHDW